MRSRLERAGKAKVSLDRPQAKEARTVLALLANFMRCFSF
jgi:hypothetical protein